MLTGLAEALLWTIICGMGVLGAFVISIAAFLLLRWPFKRHVENVEWHIVELLQLADGLREKDLVRLRVVSRWTSGWYLRRLMRMNTVYGQIEREEDGEDDWEAFYMPTARGVTLLRGSGRMPWREKPRLKLYELMQNYPPDVARFLREHTDGLLLKPESSDRQ